MPAHALAPRSHTARPTPSIAAGGACSPSAPAVGSSMADLEPLVASAATLDPSDPEAAARLCERAHAVTSRLAASGLLPAHLVVDLDDPGVLVVRTLVAALRRMQAQGHGKGREPAMGAGRKVW